MMYNHNNFSGGEPQEQYTAYEPSRKKKNGIGRKEVVNSRNIGDTISVLVIRGNAQQNITATIQEVRQ